MASGDRFMLFLVVLVPLIFANRGDALKCYSYMCTNATMGSPTCAPPEPVTCGREPGSLVHPDRCITQRITAEPIKGMFIHQEYRGCSHYLHCDSTSLCEEARGKGMQHVKHCETSCCEGDLCNNGVDPPVPRQARQSGPIGPALSCYACSNITQPGERPPITCDIPIKQTCGVDPLTNLPQDRCITIMMTAKTPGFGHVMHQEMRNCSSAHYCSEKMLCANANHTGMLSNCKVSCCFGSNCNNEGLEKLTTTTVELPSEDPTNSEGDKYARGDKAPRPTVVTAQKPITTSASAGSDMTPWGFLFYIVLLYCSVFFALD